MPTFGPVQIQPPSGGLFQQLISKQARSGGVLFYNSDANVTVYLSKLPSGNTQLLGDMSPLSPLSTIILDGTEDIFAFTLSGQKAILYRFPTSSAFSAGTINVQGNVTATVSGNVNVANTPNVNIANSPAVTISGTPSVAISGTPTITVAGQSVPIDVSAATVTINPAANAIFPTGSIAQLSNIGPLTVAASGSQATAVINVQSYLSYDMNITAFCSSQGTANAPLNFQILVQWFADAAGTIPLWQERWWGWLGNSLGNAAAMNASGPMHGPYMKVTVFNNQPSLVAFTLQSLILWGTGRTSAQSDWRQSVPGGMTTGLSTIGAYGTPGDDNLLFEIDGSALGSNQTLWQPFPLCTGLIFIRIRPSTVLNKDFVVSNFSANVNGGLGTGGTGTPGIIWDATTAAAEESAVLYTAHAPAWCIISTTASGCTLSMMVTGSRGAR